MTWVIAVAHGGLRIADMWWRAAVCAGVACAALACRSSNPEIATRDGDVTLFIQSVQPVIERHCAYLACHGREGMPLALYAVSFLRLRDPEGLVDPERTRLDETALSPMELELNRLAIAARARPDDPGGAALWRRLIPPEAGGIPHGGIVVFEREDDPDLLALRTFLETVDVR